MGMNEVMPDELFVWIGVRRDGSMEVYEWECPHGHRHPAFEFDEEEAMALMPRELRDDVAYWCLAKFNGDRVAAIAMPVRQGDTPTPIDYTCSSCKHEQIVIPQLEDELVMCESCGQQGVALFHEKGG